PTYAHDALRSGSTDAEPPGRLAKAWQVALGGHISPPVVAGGVLVVSDIDGHRIIALDARSGRRLWQYRPAGRVDSPPTLYRGMVLFGCADGRVYCLRAADGRLAWSFLAAPCDRRTIARDQVESLWPVHGSVLVQGGVAYVSAGRSSYLDGGIYLYGLDPATGEILSRSHVRSRHPKATEGAGGPVHHIVQNATDSKTFHAPDLSDAFSMAGGVTSDILVGDGRDIYLRWMRFDGRCRRQERPGWHLFSTSSLLDGTEVHRSHWVLGTGDFSRIPVAYSWIANRPGGGWGYRVAVPYGLLLAFDSRTAWSVRRLYRQLNGGPVFFPSPSGAPRPIHGYVLSAEANRPPSPQAKPLPDLRKIARGQEAPAGRQWSVELPLRPRAVVRAGEKLLVGGMPSVLDPKDPFAAYEGRLGGLLLAVSAKDGKEIARCKLDSPPVWEGLAVADGRVFLSTIDGHVVCLGPGK
ncbi:MAG: PQQ-binding-like beta-propeller repeat protein, partial [Planctomycetes bacterium]|nr:PQQ-binding-like beta-propeller repeat protein [Planctomycetota bacterium]